MTAAQGDTTQVSCLLLGVVVRVATVKALINTTGKICQWGCFDEDLRKFTGLQIFLG